jgi:hypothetical protein
MRDLTFGPFVRRETNGLSTLHCRMWQATSVIFIAFSQALARLPA